MNRERWLGALLLASWTLNVTLIVTLYLKSTYPPSAERGVSADVSFYEPMPLSPGDMEGPTPEFLPFRDRFRAELQPLESRRRELVDSLRLVFMADELDTSRLRQLTETLDSVGIAVRGRMLAHLCEVHGSLPPAERGRLGRRLMRGLMDGGGRPHRGPYTGD